MRTPTPRTMVALLSGLLVVAAGACAGRGVPNPFEQGTQRRQIRIEVTNLNFMDATLHALRGGERHRLGIVTGKGQAVYTMPWPMSLPLQIEIDLLAGDRCTTRPLQTDPGDIIQLQIEMDLLRDPDCIRGR